MERTIFCAQYSVRRLTAADVERIYALSAGNPLFYQYCPPFVTRASILRDLEALPPGKTREDKYYLGFFQRETLAAVMDLILGYPNPHTAFVGLFMMAAAGQGRGDGSRIIAECARGLAARGYRTLRLCYAKGNPQSMAFWRKNGFEETGEEYNGGQYIQVVMQRQLGRANCGPMR